MTITLSRDGTAQTARTAVVIPVASEVALRQWEWVEHNRDYVDAQVAAARSRYVYLPDTADDGFTFFNRMFFSAGRQGRADRR